MDSLPSFIFIFCRGGCKGFYSSSNTGTQKHVSGSVEYSNGFNKHAT